MAHTFGFRLILRAPGTLAANAAANAAAAAAATCASDQDAAAVDAGAADAQDEAQEGEGGGGAAAAAAAGVPLALQDLYGRLEVGEEAFLQAARPRQQLAAGGIRTVISPMNGVIKKILAPVRSAFKSMCRSDPCTGVLCIQIHVSQ